MLPLRELSNEVRLRVVSAGMADTSDRLRRPAPASGSLLLDLATLDFDAGGVDGQVKHTPMAGSKLLRCDLVDGFAGVAVMQHEHAGAGTGDCGGIALGAEERNELGGRRHQGTAIRLVQFVLRGGEQQRVGLGLSGRKLVGERDSRVPPEQAHVSAS